MVNLNLCEYVSIKMEVNPPTRPTNSTTLQKYWMSAEAELFELDGFIHEQWARAAIG